ncbi:MAG: nitroreductase family deazaflavin-dependent oxidoreductase [Deltaproteobacteria bacterium]|nr:nitroreductase family deazaflavin-dependent oxidoreductase [Deltaproteobacteria bacterium]MBW2397727.1 nitroreductase family deazaflavin-dependent oxidoreductase [Deltaproteobacteria bacterium]MBW2664864.1 nitroreductase family deazaflavin-dependent oxidoreductase [Deltaproteobacteria bacterium]
MANWAWVTKVHRAIYQKTDGRVGARLAGLPMCLLTTVGRKSGLLRTLPLACFPDGDDLIVVASNNGQEHDPAWWLNLREQPEAEVQFGRERRRMTASRATPEEQARLWPWLKQRNPAYARYDGRTEREIPIVILRDRS